MAGESRRERREEVGKEKLKKVPYLLLQGSPYFSELFQKSSEGIVYMTQQKIQREKIPAIEFLTGITLSVHMNCIYLQHLSFYFFPIKSKIIMSSES